MTPETDRDGPAIEADALLSDGATVHVRQIRPEDADLVVALHSRFSERTRYFRYFSPYPRIPPRDLHRFVNVDHHDREAFVVQQGPDLLAIGRYERLGPDATDAEVAFVVEDAHQGRGIGSLLLEHLAVAAQHAGITRFVAEVLPQNSAMLRVFADAGYQVSREYADGVVHLTFPIAPTERSIEVQWRREHRSEAASIARLLTPKSLVLYGVRQDGTGLGAAILRHVREGGFTGQVHVAGRGSTVEADLAVVAVPAAELPSVVAHTRAHGLVIFSAGFAETGDPAGAEAQRRLVAMAHAEGLRVIGPNCLGIANTDPAVRLNATLAPALPERGRVGLFCQSGVLGVALLAQAHRRGIGLSCFVSVGNRADVSGNDLLQYWREDPATDVVLLYLETFGNPRKFARIARVLGREKPIVAVVTGNAPKDALSHPSEGAPPPSRSPETQGSHPREGAPPPSPSPENQLRARSGVIQVETVAELFDVGALLSRQPLPAGPRVGVVSNAAALGVLAADRCARAGLTVPDPYPTAVAISASAAELAAAVAAAGTDERVDSVVVAVSPPLPGVSYQGEPAGFAAAVAEAARGADRPVLATFIDHEELHVRNIPLYSTVEEAVRALAHAVSYAQWRREPLGAIPQLSNVDPSLVRPGMPVEDLLAAYGIPVVPAISASTEEGVIRAAEQIGYPVALKASRPELRHRLDLGAVRLGLGDENALLRAYREMVLNFGLEFLVQRMEPPGVACVMEVVDDPAFGPIVGFGLGGLATELLGDRAWRTAPLTDVDAASLLSGPRAAPMLTGYRGATPVDAGALTDLLLRLGRLADEQPGVSRLSLNPVLAYASGAAVLHASVHYGTVGPRPDTGPRRL